MAQDSTFPLADAQILENPFPYFKQRRQDSPILFHAEWNAWFIFNHEDIVALSRDPRLSNQRMDLFKQGAPDNVQSQLDFLETDLRTMVVMLDEPDHHRVRQNLQKGFTPHIIQGLEPGIVRHIDTLIDGLPKDGGTCELAGLVCRHLPLVVLAELFDLPAEDFSKLQHWAYDFIEYFNRQPVPEEYALALVRSGKEMLAYTRKLIGERRANPGSDLISALVKAQTETDGLSDDEIAANVLMVLIAGDDTVGSILGSAVHLLLTHPEQLAKVEAGEVSWTDAFEECLRYEPANPVIMRKVSESFTYKGHTFEKQQFVFLALASGSRDETHIQNGEAFDVARPGTRHLTFGSGAHYCIGAALTHVEALALLPRLFRRLSGLRLDPEQDTVWLRTLGVRGPRTLPVAYDRVLSA